MNLGVQRIIFPNDLGFWGFKIWHLDAEAHMGCAHFGLKSTRAVLEVQCHFQPFLLNMGHVSLVQINTGRVQSSMLFSAFLMNTGRVILVQINTGRVSRNSKKKC